MIMITVMLWLSFSIFIGYKVDQHFSFGYSFNTLFKDLLHYASAPLYNVSSLMLIKIKRRSLTKFSKFRNILSPNLYFFSSTIKERAKNLTDKPFLSTFFKET